MLLFKRTKREPKTEDVLSQSDFDLMQQENDKMLDQIEALKCVRIAIRKPTLIRVVGTK